MTGSGTPTPPATLLAFDYGDRRIGVAVGQTVTATAAPIGSLRVVRSRPDWAAIDEVVRRWEPDALVVGLPINMDGTDQDVTGRARRFAARLGERFGLEVHLMDERLTTREAKSRLEALGRAGEDDDPIAAQVILESWLREAAGTS